MLNFEEIMVEFRRERSRKSSQSTVDRYDRHVRNWKDWLEESRGKSLWEVDNVDLRVFIKNLDRDGLAPTTISQRVSAISKFYQDADTTADEHEMPSVPDNPYDNLKDKYKTLLRGDTKKKQALEDKTGDEYPYLEPDKISKLKDNVPAPRHRNEMIIMLLFNCGFRRGELAHCKIDHINREDKSVFIPPRKTDKSRYVSYNEDYLGFHLDQWLDYGGRDSMTYADESEYLLPTNSSPRISGDYINQMVKDTAEKAGIQEILTEYSDGREIHKVTAHTLRHSFAMQSLNSGIDIRTLQTLLGHDELDTTLIYLQQSKDAAKEESRQFKPES